MFTIEYVEGVADDLAGIRPFDRRQLVDRIEEQLKHEPTTPSRNKKMLVGLIPPWDHMPPVWQLRVGDYRVFYDVDASEQRVSVRAVRHKPPHTTTEDIL